MNIPIPDLFVLHSLEKYLFLKKWNQFSHIPKYSTFKNHNVGILTGKSSGITILDIDFKNNGMKFGKLLVLYIHNLKLQWLLHLIKDYIYILNIIKN